ncbi:NAD-dependent epimerase/dehydratase family protein [Larkinella rosea]|uniref:NAD(P)-dependent oxidoreductase n=1 Tax=Larkinella rosea TaxID=2025312 RepID=A0A3P1BIM4_9BACT|nr:NAD(P)-dependent oxidoreductase [Larkinella rosea]RRB00746.1 NAD(P)-dependent oxidoreductase [Larkinella rosea]
MSDLASFEQELINPSAALVADLTELDGDIIILGVGGKMGPGLARLARKAIDQAGISKRVIGVSRFSDPQLQIELEADGIETISADLLNETDLAALPDVRNVLYLAGTKFGTTGKEAFTWAMNAYLPGRVAEKYRHSRIVAFSTGNVYPFTSVTSGGATEETAPEPVGEYGQSCLGRERIFQYFAEKNNTPTLIYRLNYAIDLRYGVLLEIAKSVIADKPIDLRMGNANVIWQGDANEIAIRALRHCAVPAKLLNVTGPETVSIQWLAQEYGRMLGKEPVFINEAQPTALLSNASQANRLFGYPRVTLRQMMELTVLWLQSGGKILNKPTHFQERTGKF